MANPAFRIHFLEWFQEFFLKEICDEFKGFSSGLWQTSFQKLRISGKTQTCEFPSGKAVEIKYD